MDWYSIPDAAFSALTDAEVEALTDGTPTTVDATTLTWYSATDFEHGLLTDVQYTTLGDGRALARPPIHIILVTTFQGGKETPADPIKITVVEVHT